MSRTRLSRPAGIAWMALAGLLTACPPSIAPFSLVAYEQATSLKVDALAMMGKATKPFADHRAEVEALVSKVDKAYEYAKNRPKNEYSTQQWEKLKDPDANLLGGFLKRWEQQSTMSKVFVDEVRGLVRDAFDEIIGLESGKNKPGQ